MEKVDCVAGNVIFNQGDKGDFFYVLASGEFVVHKDGNRVCVRLIVDIVYRIFLTPHLAASMLRVDATR